MKYFGTAGIRGITNVEITNEISYKVGRVLGFLSKRVCVARDTRKGSEMLLDAAISGILESGSEVLNCEVVPLGVLANFCRRNRSMGIMITGSHTPPEINGIVVLREDGSDINREEERKIEELIDSEIGREHWKRIKEKTFCREEALDNYRELLDMFKTDRKIRVVIDCANGTLSTILSILHDYMDVFSINSHPVGIPARKPEPRKESISYIGCIVRKVSANMGLGVDIDSDRGVYLDERGLYVEEDLVGAFFASKILKCGDRMVTPINSSMLIEHVARQKGFEVCYSAVGPPEIAEKVREVNAKYSYEESGKYMFPPYTFWGDAVISTLYLARILENKPLSSIRETFPKYYQIKASVECPNKMKKEIMNNLLSNLDVFSSMGDIKNCITLDGIKIIYENSWILIRPSGTEPLIRVFAESSSPDEAERLASFGVKVVKGFL